MRTDGPMTVGRTDPARRAVVLGDVFAGLAVLHLGLLPVLLSERLDDAVAFAAGAVYLLLAFGAWRRAEAAERP